MNGFSHGELESYWDEYDGPIERQVTAIVIGAGLRGQNYSTFSLDFPSRLKIVGVAEPIKIRRKKMQDLYGISNDRLVEDWKEFTKLPKFADIAFICTQDQFHKAPAIAFSELGYHLLLEKPMATTKEDCEEVTRICNKNNTIVTVCLVPRHFPPCRKIKEIIAEGKIGEVVLIKHAENIGWWHFAHSYVRGNWRNENMSTFSFLAKCCHDVDLVRFWMGERKVKKVHSFGSLHHFNKNKKPEGASDRCYDCKVENDCPYSAIRIYENNLEGHWPNDWPMSAVCDIEDYSIGSKGYKEKLSMALKTGPFGKCVYACDNNVVDHQIVTLEFDNGALATIIMNGFTEELNREVSISGTHGEIRWDGDEHSPIVVYDFTNRKTTKYSVDLAPANAICRDHEGADFFIMNSFTKAVAANDASLGIINIDECLKSHLLVFAAEEARKEKKVLSTDI